MRPVTAGKRIGSVLGLGIAVLNIAAYRQARAFAHFARPGHRTRPQLSKDSQLREAKVFHAMGFNATTTGTGPRGSNATSPSAP